MDRILELLARVLELTTEERQELTAALADLTAYDADDLARIREAVVERAQELREVAETAPSAAVAEAANVLATVHESVVGEEDRRGQEAAEAQEQANAALGRILDSRNEGDDQEQDPAPGEEQPAREVDPVNPAGPDPDPQHHPIADPLRTDEDAPERQDDQARVPVAASGRPQRPSRAAASAARPRGAAPRPQAPELAANRLVATGEGRVRAGHAFSSRQEFADALVETLTSIQPGEKRAVGRVHRAFPEDRVLRSGNDELNTRRVEAVVASALAGPAAVTAAGGLTAPLPTLYDVDVLGSADRPLLAALPTLNAADRGGLTWRGRIAPSALAGSVGRWTMQDDVDAGTAGAPDPVKPVIEVAVPGTSTIQVEAITQRIRFTNIMARYDREAVAANVEAAEIIYAQVHELDILTRIDGFLKTVTAARRLGAVRDVLSVCDHARAYYRNRHRLGDAQRLQFVLPRWALDLMRLDVMRSLGSTESPEALAVADAQILGWFDRRNIDPVFVWEGRAAQAAVTGPPAIPAIAAETFPTAADGGALPGFPDQLTLRVFMPGDVLYVDGGDLDLGVVRDSALNAINRYETFYEEFWNVAWRGVEGLRVVADVQPTGEVSGTASGAAFND